MSYLCGFDPGRDKCGIAVMSPDHEVVYHEVIGAEKALSTLQLLGENFGVKLLIMGDQTTSKIWKKEILAQFPELSIVQVDERYSSLEARERYWQIYPPQGWSKLIPRGMRTPPRPIDDLVAIILIERYLEKGGKNL